MGSPLHTFKFVRLLFSLQAADCLNLPEYKGSALRTPPPADTTTLYGHGRREIWK